MALTKVTSIVLESKGTAGTYSNVTTDAQGRVVSGNNSPTITDGSINNTPVGVSTPAVGNFTNLTATGDLTVAGNLTINGTTTTINSTVVSVDDAILNLGGDTAPTVDDAKDKGITFQWHNGTNPKIGFFGFDRSANAFTFIPDASITSEAISGTAGTLNNNALTATTLQTARTIGISGDGTGTATSFNGSSNITIPFTLGTSGVTAGTYNGSATTVTPFTVDSKGRITATGTAVTIAPAFSSITSKPTTLNGYGITDAQPLDATLTAVAGVTTAADKVVYFTAADTATTMTVTSAARSLLDDTSSSAMLTTLGAAPLASPVLTGTPTTPTASPNTNTTQIASTAFVYSARPVQGSTTVATTGTSFTMPSSITKPIVVAVDGVIQTDYTTTTTIITFTETLPVGSVIFVLGYTG